ncbi:Microtubule-actin cross-linking factor 1, partial [Fragariocoptes setiger]
RESSTIRPQQQQQQQQQNAQQLSLKATNERGYATERSITQVSSSNPTAHHRQQQQWQQQQQKQQQQQQRVSISNRQRGVIVSEPQVHCVEPSTVVAASPLQTGTSSTATTTAAAAVEAANLTTLASKHPQRQTQCSTGDIRHSNIGQTARMRALRKLSLSSHLLRCRLFSNEPRVSSQVDHIVRNRERRGAHDNTNHDNDDEQPHHMTTCDRSHETAKDNHKTRRLLNDDEGNLKSDFSLNSNSDEFLDSTNNNKQSNPTTTTTNLASALRIIGAASTTQNISANSRLNNSGDDDDEHDELSCRRQVLHQQSNDYDYEDACQHDDDDDDDDGSHSATQLARHSTHSHHHNHDLQARKSTAANQEQTRARASQQRHQYQQQYCSSPTLSLDLAISKVGAANSVGNSSDWCQCRFFKRHKFCHKCCQIVGTARSIAGAQATAQTASINLHRRRRSDCSSLRATVSQPHLVCRFVDNSRFTAPQLQAVTADAASSTKRRRHLSGSSATDSRSSSSLAPATTRARHSCSSSSTTEQLIGNKQQLHSLSDSCVATSSMSAASTLLLLSDFRQWYYDLHCVCPIRSKSAVETNDRRHIQSQSAEPSNSLRKKSSTSGTSDIDNTPSHSHEVSTNNNDYDYDKDRDRDRDRVNKASSQESALRSKQLQHQLSKSTTSMDYNQNSFEAWYQSRGKPISLLHLDHADRIVIKIADERDAIQKKTFTKWINKYLAKSGCRINDLFQDIRDGRHLISLLEILSGSMLPRERGRMRVHMLQNVQIALNYIKFRQVKLVNIRPEDIVDGNQKLILGLIWTIILHFQLIMA